MERIQFYPNKLLKSLLENEAKEKGISISSLVVELLQEHYKLKSIPEISLQEAKEKVLDEVEQYVNTIVIGEKFDLLRASETFRNIDMTVAGKPSTNRATIGRHFGRKINEPPFSNIAVSYKSNGEPELSKNNATVYIKIK